MTLVNLTAINFLFDASEHLRWQRGDVEESEKAPGRSFTAAHFVFVPVLPLFGVACPL